MMNTGKCPKCDKPITDVIIEPVKARARDAQFNGISYVCPSCRAVLSVSIDLLALKNDVLS